jgi:hypothetical protein
MEKSLRVVNIVGEMKVIKYQVTGKLIYLTLDKPCKISLSWKRNYVI